MTSHGYTTGLSSALHSHHQMSKSVAQIVPLSVSENPIEPTETCPTSGLQHGQRPTHDETSSDH